MLLKEMKEANMEGKERKMMQVVSCVWWLWSLLGVLFREVPLIQIPSLCCL